MSAFVNPGFTSPSLARATHQLGAAFAYLPLFLGLGAGAGGLGDWPLRFLSSPKPQVPSPFEIQLEGRRRDEGEFGTLPHHRHEPHRIDLRLRSEL